MANDEIKQRLKHLIIESLQLEGVTVESIGDDVPLIGTGLGLDSIDALELVVRLEKEFGVKIRNSEEARQALQSINTLADFLKERAP